MVLTFFRLWRMVIFIHEERAYLSWLAHHRHGFVLDMLRKPTRKPPVLHRASCQGIRVSPGRQSHWTTGRHVKACGLDLAELLAWTQTETDREAVYCQECQPADPAFAAEHAPEKRLTKLGKDILDYVVEAAVVCLDQHAAYDTSIADLATYLDKTPAQLATALSRLTEDGYLRIEGSLQPGQPVPATRRLFPTADALRTLPAFHQMSVRKVNEELQQLNNQDEELT